MVLKDLLHMVGAACLTTDPRSIGLGEIHKIKNEKASIDP
jgi:hypothetical protein